MVETKKLELHATAAGFDSVEKYVAEFVLTLAKQPNAAEQFAPIADNELAASLAMIDRGMSQIRSGQGLNIAEARRHTLEQLGRGKE